MRFVPLSDVQEGMALGRTLYGANGEILLSKGTVLKDKFIRRIHDLQYNGIYIEDDVSEGMDINELVDPEVKQKAVKVMKTAFHRIEKGLNHTETSKKEIQAIVDTILEDIMSNKDIIVNIIDLKMYDDYTFHHSTNVAILATVLGIACKLNKKDLYELCMAGILHDIGKVTVPDHILNKKEKLTDEEWQEMQKHAENGYRILKEKFQLPTKAYIGVLQHHERYDGTGYPHGKKGRDISLFGRILNIADVYDALTSDRPYRKGWPPAEALEFLMGNGGVHFDPHLVQIFYQKISPYPVGTVVCLSNNKKGIVKKNCEGLGLRPLVRIIQEDNQKVSPYDIDLSQPKNNAIAIIM